MIPITHHHNDEDRRGKICQCSVCKIETACRADFDFWADMTAGDPEGKPLMCETCMMAALKSKGYVLKGFGS